MLAAEAARPSADLTVGESSTPSAFLALEQEWNALALASGASPFSRHECIRVWTASFAPGARLLVLTARDTAGRLVAALPLLAETGLVCGVPARQLVSTANSHSSRFDMLAEDARTAARAFLAHLLARPGWDLLRLVDVPEGGSAWQIHAAAEEQGLPVGSWESQRSPYLALPSTHEEMLSGLSSHFKANLRRRRRQLEKLGALSLERITGNAGLEESLQAGLALEQAGWKGREGTAIAQDSKTESFYRELASCAASGGYLSLFLLKLDGKPIAFQFGLSYGGIYSLLKIAYDESLKAYGPGQLLVEETIKDAISRGATVYDFLGDEMDWKKEWCATVRAHHWLFVFRDTAYGHALRRAKFDLLPAARQALSVFERKERAG